ncbi:MAG: hypothetical protein M3N47_04975 [Chloroflexota bacterium]|nr:hypothetical protein [Chloroflexota bacterium]
MTIDLSPGTCFGFAVRSSLPFHYLRTGAGQPLEVSAPAVAPQGDAGELLFEWAPSSRFPLAGRLIRADPGFRLWVDTWGWFLVDPGAPRVTLPETLNIVRREERLWSIPAILCFLARGDAALHAAAVEVDGKAVVLAAPGSFGKTTLAAAFHSAGYRLLSEDTTCIRTQDPPLVVPGPAMLRLRHDVAAQLEVPNATPVGNIEDDRVHLALDAAVRGDGSPVALGAVVLLRQAHHGLRIERVASAQAVRDLWSLSFRLPTDDDRARCFAAVADLARAIPVWNLYRPLTMRDLPATVDFVARHA